MYTCILLGLKSFSVSKDLSKFWNCYPFVESLLIDIALLFFFFFPKDCENLLKRFLVLNPTKRSRLEVGLPLPFSNNAHLWRETGV